MANPRSASTRKQGTNKAGERQESAAARRAERARVALYEATDGRAFARAVFRLMLATVPGDYVSASFHCTPSPTWGAWLASNGSTMSQELMMEISKVHLGLPTLMANPGIKAIPTRGVLPPEAELVETPFYRLFMQPYGWRHSVALFCWKSVSPPSVDCIFCVHRTAEQGDFSDEEIAQIAALHPEIDRARQRVAGLAEQRGALRSLQHFMRDLPVPAVLLSWQGELLYHNREGAECCTLWEHGAAAGVLKPRYQLPLALRAGCSALKEQWNAQRAIPGVARHQFRRTMYRPGTPALTARVSLLPVESDLVSDPNLLIVFEKAGRRASKAVPAPQTALAELSRLTPRQREITTLTGEGKSNSEIATALGCTLSTVKAGLFAAFKKLGVASRAQLMRKLATQGERPWKA